MKKNGILTLLFACIPGAGQMYQGYMKRGLSLITMFCLFIIVGSATGRDRVLQQHHHAGAGRCDVALGTG